MVLGVIQMRIAIALFICAMFLCAFQQYRIALARADTATAHKELAEVRQRIAEQSAAAEREARETERLQRDAIEAVRTRYQEEMKNAQGAHDLVVADLRRDALRLRAHWQGCTATADLSAAAAGAAGIDGAAGLRASSAGRIIGAGAECDAQVRGLQSVIRAYTGDEG